MFWRKSEDLFSFANLGTFAFFWLDVGNSDTFCFDHLAIVGQTRRRRRHVGAIFRLAVLFF